MTDILLSNSPWVPAAPPPPGKILIGALVTLHCYLAMGLHRDIAGFRRQSYIYMVRRLRKSTLQRLRST